MAYKRGREDDNGDTESSETLTAVDAELVGDGAEEPLPGSETLDPPDHGSPAGYELCREQRIKENLERMQKLGIFDLSLKMKSAVASAASQNRKSRKVSSERKTPVRVSSISASEPRRRSSRLQNVAPVSYMEQVKFPDEGKRKNEIWMEEGAKPEVYTEEHEKLLGSTELTWTLFVDGCGADGKRIYDPVRGKTCHQCRQKTLGHRTHCSKCQMVQGQFCGDCLYMRYGEHVLEANKNPDWTCPPCRGICNCSLCRQAKGWPPTGSMYKRVTNLGYKSVAHFLIQTMRAPPEAEAQETVNKTPRLAPPKEESKKNDDKTPLSAKRSLAFSDMEVPADGHEIGQKLNFGESEGKEHNGNQMDAKIAENDGQMKTELTPEPVNLTVSSSIPSNEGCEKKRRGRPPKHTSLTPNQDSIASNQMDAKIAENDGQMKAEMIPEPVNLTVSSGISSNEGCEKKRRGRPPKPKHTSSTPNQDSIASRLKSPQATKVGESDVIKEGVELVSSKNDDKMKAEMIPEPVNLTVSPSTLKSGGVGCGNEVPGVLKAGTGSCGNKSRGRPRKLHAALSPNQDGVASRLRSRGVKA